MFWQNKNNLLFKNRNSRKIPPKYDLFSTEVPNPVFSSHLVTCRSQGLFGACTSHKRIIKILQKSEMNRLSKNETTIPS